MLLINAIGKHVGLAEAPLLKKDSQEHLERSSRIMLKVYGLKNCDSCQKALKWLESEGIDYQFLDVRKDGFTKQDAQKWLDAHGWETVINRRGTSWRMLDDMDKTDITPNKALALALETPALVKRPVFVNGDFTAIGFTADVQAALKAIS